MTSVGVISGAVVEVISLKDVTVNPPETLQKETDQLLAGLEQVKQLLAAAYDRKTVAQFVEEEKEAVQLSYEIVNAVADASSLRPPKDMLASLLHRKKPAGNTKLLEELRNRLTGLQGRLEGNTTEIPDRPLQSQKSSSFLSMMKSPKRSTKSQKNDRRIQEQGSPPRLSRAGSEHRLAGLTIQEQGSLSRAGSEQVLPGLEIKEQKPHGYSASSEKNPMIKREELLNLLIEKLMKADSSSELYLVGESGMGKTTLARKLFHDDRLRNMYRSFAWVPITRNFEINSVFELLLQQLGPHQGVNETDLIPQIFDRLKDRPYLLVLDDIESIDDWESIHLALPNSKLGKVVITASSMDIARDKVDQRHLVSGLHETEITALFKDESSSLTDEASNAIFNISGGSPLFATILGKSLQSAEPNDRGEFIGELRYCDSAIKGTPLALEASYKRLGHETKPRLLHLGLFPAGQDVDIDKLYLMLAAENLITKDSNLKPPQSLGEYLKELHALKLVQVQQDHVVPARGLYKSCRLHDQVWEFCRSKASGEEFLQIVDFGCSTPENAGSNTRRLALYLRGQANSAPQSISQETLKKLWTLVVVDTFEKKSKWPLELNDLTESGYLKVLSFDGVDFVEADRMLPKGIDRLVFLKYLSFRGCRLDELPSSLAGLALLETLDLLVQDDCIMTIPNYTFANKKRMLHLYFPKKYKSGDDGKTKLQLQSMDKLITLVNFDTGVCDVEALKQFKKLRILSTISKGSLGTALFEFLTQASSKELQYSAVDITSFDRYDSSSLSELKKLLSSSPSVHSVHVEGRIGGLHMEEKEEGKAVTYSETIREIVLDGSQLQVDPMNYLGMFGNLHGLVLSNEAFLGTEITISAALFPNLRSLRIHNLRLLKKLTIQNYAVRELSALHIHSCASLSEVSIPKKLHDKLREAQVDNGGDAYSITPYPSVFKITPSPPEFALGCS